MKNPKVLLYSIILFTINQTYSQKLNLDNYKWKNRLFLVVTNDSINQQTQTQLKEISNLKDNFIERKLVLIEIQKNKYRITDYSDDKKTDWVIANQIHKKYIDNKAPFRVILIG